MKKILTPFLVLLLSISSAEAQYTYELAPCWQLGQVAKMGPYNLTVVYHYDTSVPIIRQLYRNGSTIGPTYYLGWEPVEEIVLSGSGTDTLSLGVQPNSNGWGAMVKILDQNYNELEVIDLFSQRHPSIPPVVNPDDPYSETAPNVVYYAQVQSEYHPGTNPEDYTVTLYARLWSSWSGYDVTQSWTFPISSAPMASFSLPFGFIGEYCVRWWMTVEHNTICPKFWQGEMEVWSYEPPCGYYFGDISTDVAEAVTEEFSVYPNPFQDALTVVSPSVSEYWITSLTGQIVSTGRLAQFQNQFEVSGLASGTYILSTPEGVSIRLVKD